MKRYKSKKDKNYFLLILTLLMNVWVILNDMPWLVGVFFTIFGVTMFFLINKIRNSVDYFILNEFLVVKTPFTTTSVDIKTIRKVQTNRSFLRMGRDNATAPSRDALEIHYQKFETLLVSPEDKNEFIRDLLAINSQIQVRVE